MKPYICFTLFTITLVCWWQHWLPEHIRGMDIGQHTATERVIKPVAVKPDREWLWMNDARRLEYLEQAREEERQEILEHLALGGGGIAKGYWERRR